MDLTESLHLLAERNLSGVAFLGAYGLTWLVCFLIWRRASERTAALATLFQGLVAFPVAMLVSALLGSLGDNPPGGPQLTQLSILIGTSQLLGLPLLILLFVRRDYPLVPYAFAVITSMHFVLYSWLYQTPYYIVMAVLISIGTTVVMAATPDDRPRRGAAATCLVTGGLLLATGALFLLRHLVLA